MLIRNNRDDTARVWLNQTEYREEFLPSATGYDHALACRLGAEAGLRANEIARVKPADITEVRVTNSHDPSLPDVLEGTMLRITGEKDTRRDTTDDASKERDAYLPDDTRRAMVRYQNDRHISDSDYLFSNADGGHLSTKTIRNYIKRVAEATAEETGDERYEYVSSHDMRRYYATTMLQQHGINPEVLMRVGGWEDYDSLKPYLREATDEVVLAEFHQIGKA